MRGNPARFASQWAFPSTSSGAPHDRLVRFPRHQPRRHRRRRHHRRQLGRVVPRARTRRRGLRSRRRRRAADARARCRRLARADGTRTRRRRRDARYPALRARPGRRAARRRLRAGKRARTRRLQDRPVRAHGRAARAPRDRRLQFLRTHHEPAAGAVPARRALRHRPPVQSTAPDSAGGSGGRQADLGRHHRTLHRLLSPAGQAPDPPEQGSSGPHRQPPAGRPVARSDPPGRRQRRQRGRHRRRRVARPRPALPCNRAGAKLTRTGAGTDGAPGGDARLRAAPRTCPRRTGGAPWPGAAMSCCPARRHPPSTCRRWARSR